MFRPKATSNQDDVANAITRLSSTLRDFSIPFRGHHFHEILSKSSILCEDLKALLQQEKEYTKWKLIQHDEIDKRIQPLRDVVEDVKNGIRELTPEYELDYSCWIQELEAWIIDLRETQEEFENHMGIRYGVLGCRIYVVQAEVDLLLELQKSKSRVTVTQSPCVERVDGSILCRWGRDEESRNEIREAASIDEDGTPPPPDSPPARSVIVNSPVVTTPESASGNMPLAHRPR